MVKKISKEIMDIVDANIKAREKKPAANSLSKQRIDKLFRMFCIHRVEYKKDEPFPDVWEDCSACILYEIPWLLKTANGHKRDLCFAIWHEGVLNG